MHNRNHHLIRRTLVPLLAAPALLWMPHAALAKAPARRHPPPPSVLEDFATLSTVRPRACPAGEAAGPSIPNWKLSATECGWRGLLQARRWSAPADGPAAAGSPAACTGNAAQWWAAARASYRGAALPSLAWHAGWTSQVIADDSGAEKRLAVIVRGPDGGWRASEWRWRPSERPATRRWQQGRWQLLLDEAARLRQAAPPPQEGKDGARLRAAWERNLGNRAGEVRAGVWQWPAAGYCMKADTAGASPGQFRLPYLIDDSRLEQRAAMQLQLARRHVGAVWLKTFRPLEATPSPAPGGPAAAPAAAVARYEAIWQDRDTVIGQLWIPVKGGGPVLRLRLSARLKSPSAEAANAAAGAIEREMAGIAHGWGTLYE